jgi:hypothetical protein
MNAEKVKLQTPQETHGKLTQTLTMLETKRQEPAEDAWEYTALGADQDEQILGGQAGTPTPSP